jgi:sulfate adenylyltransferase large subunit
VDERPILRVATAGSVDDGKSTLIGRLLHDSGCVLEDQMEDLRKRSANLRGGAADLSLLTDGLKAEREQGITIDVAYRHFASARRRFLLADVPGHEQYMRNMVTGASTADVLVILVDVRQGLTAQTRRHAHVAWLLGIRRIVMAINKMDLVGFDRGRFLQARAACRQLVDGLPGVTLDALPVSALDGDNVAVRSTRTQWYAGPSLLELLETTEAPAPSSQSPLRVAVQYVIRPDLHFRGYAGRIESGHVKVGQAVTVMPSGARTRVKRIATFDGDLDEAIAPMAVTLVLADEIDVSRGDWICAASSAPMSGSRFDASVVWMHEHPLGAGESLLLQHGSARVPVWVERVRHRIDPATGQPEPVSQLGINEIGTVRLETGRPIAFDRYETNRQTGSFILIDPVDNFTLAAGMVQGPAAPSVDRESEPPRGLKAVTPEERFARHGHRPAVVVSRSAAVIFGLQRALFQRGAAVAVLQSLPPAELLRDLLANGMILLAPPGGPPSVTDYAWLDAPGGEPAEAVAATLRALERAAVLPSGELCEAGGGI